MALPPVLAGIGFAAEVAATDQLHQLCKIMPTRFVYFRYFFVYFDLVGHKKARYSGLGGDVSWARFDPSQSSSCG